jgi:hypothetical protein
MGGWGLGMVLRSPFSLGSWVTLGLFILCWGWQVGVLCSLRLRPEEAELCW